MKKISILALAMILTAGLLTACKGTMSDETTEPSGSTGTSATTAPTTAPTAAPTTPATRPAPTEPSKNTSPTETTGGVNTLDPSENGNGRMGPRMPWSGMAGHR